MLGTVWIHHSWGILECISIFNVIVLLWHRDVIQSVVLLIYTGNQNRVLEVFTTCGHKNVPTPCSRSATLLYSNILQFQDYFKDKPQIIILDIMFQNPNFTTYWQLENIIQSPGGVADTWQKCSWSEISVRYSSVLTTIFWIIRMADMRPTRQSLK